MVLEPPLFIPVRPRLRLARVRDDRPQGDQCRPGRRPDVGIPALLVITFCLTFMLDVILEGVIWMPFGVYTYVGGHWPLLFPDAYHMFPLNEAIFIGTWSTLVVFLYVPKRQGPDAGRAGHRQVKGGPVKKAALQILAMIAIFQIGLAVLYTVPQVAWFGSKPNEWPKDAQERSYLVDNICGPEADWACPVRASAEPRRRAGPERLRIRAEHLEGGAITEGDAGPVAEAVPFSDEEKGPFNGPIFQDRRLRPIN